MEQMFLQVWDKLGTPLTVIFWGYIIMYTLAAVGAFIVFFIVLRMFWKDRALFKDFDNLKRKRRGRF